MNKNDEKMLDRFFELSNDNAALRAENKCLREDRDAWKEYAMRVMPQMPTVTAPAPITSLCGCPPGTVCNSVACPYRVVIT